MERGLTDEVEEKFAAKVEEKLSHEVNSWFDKGNRGGLDCLFWRQGVGETQGEQPMRWCLGQSLRWI